MAEEVIVNVPTDAGSPTADFAIQHMGKSSEEIRELWNAQSTPATTEPVVTDPVVTEAVVTEVVVDTPTPEAVVEATPTPSVVDWSEFGVSNSEELKANLSKLTEYESIVNKYKEIEPQLSVLDQVKNPFANDSIAQLNNFVSKTGITNLNLASEILNTSEEELAKDPLKAVAIKEILNDPSLASMPMNKLIQYVATKNGVDMNEYGSEGYELPVVLEVDGKKAIQQISDKKKEFANINNYFVDLQNNTVEQQRLSDARKQKWEVASPSIVSSIKGIEIVVPSPIEGLADSKVTVAVSSDEVRDAFSKVQGYFSSNVEPDSVGFKNAQDVVLANLRLAKMNEIIKETVKAYEGKIREQIVKETHNLSPITPDTAAPTTVEKYESPNVTEINRRFAR